MKIHKSTSLKNSIIQNWLIISILIIAAILRFWNYWGFSLSNDELSALNRTQFNSLKEMLWGGVWVDGHPAGVQIFLYYWVKVFGNSEAVIRFPFVLCGILSVFFAYKAASLWFSKGAGIFVAIVTGFLEFPLLYSNIARPYSPGLMFVMLQAWYWKKILTETEINTKQKILNSVIFCTSITGAIYTHYFAGLMSIIIGLTGLFYINKKNYIFYIFSYIIAVLLFLPHLPFTLNHLSIGGIEEWLTKPDKFWFFKHIFNFFNKDFVLLFFIIAISILAYIINPQTKKLNSLRIVALIWAILPFIIAYIYSYKVNSVLQDSVLLFSTPFLLFVAGSFFPEKINRTNSIILILTAIVVLTSTLIVKKHFKQKYFTDFKSVVQQTRIYEKQYNKKNICKIFNVNDPYYVMYYAGKDTSGTAKWIVENENDYMELGEIVRKSNTPFLMYSKLKPDNYIIHDIIRSKYPYLIEYNNFGGSSEIYLYSKKDLSSFAETAPQIVYGHGFEGNNRWKGELERVDTVSYSGALGLKIKPEDEYSVGWIAYVDTLPLNKGIKCIRVETYMLTDNAGSLQLVLSIDDIEGKSIRWSSSPAKYFIDTNKWSKIIHTFYANSSINWHNKIIKTYIWNPSKNKAYIDDFSISFY